jgi:hypothetical protein
MIVSAAAPSPIQSPDREIQDGRKAGPEQIRDQQQGSQPGDAEEPHHRDEQDSPQGSDISQSRGR